MIIKNIYYQPANAKTKKIYTDERFDVLHINLESNEELKPHKSATDAFLLVTEGEIIFSIKNEDHFLKKGDSLSFKAGEIHSVRSVVPASFLLVK